MSVGGVFLRFGGFFLRILQFFCSAVGLGIFSYFLAVLADKNLPIATKWKAVEGLTGAATLYTIFGVVFILCLGGNAFFGFLAVVLDILFVGASIAVAIMTRHGADSCTGNVQTPLGNGPADRNSPDYGSNGKNATYSINLRLACRLNTAVFAVSIIAAFLFLITAGWQVLMVRHHKKEKKYGPSPANNYTSGSGRRPFWRRNKRTNRDMEAAGAVGASRPSAETGTTVGNNAYAPEPKYGEPGYGQPGYGQTGVYHNRVTGNF